MNMYRPTEGVNDLSKQFIISYETFVDALNYIAKQHHIISMNDALFSSFLTNETVADPSGDRSIRILADGSITPSTYLIDETYIVANITEPNVLDKIEKSNMLTNLIVKTIPSECKGCAYENSCAGGVYDRRYLWYGTLEKKIHIVLEYFMREIISQ
ncbi:SPASM domain-containing protein [uncultured Ruminococcus sp.]|uniref:SPASM domain-containing protein n=1 Tax=uncultured Ruminococcus sp. TaxID=165186 RepID=UPI0026DC39DB|nr:SPASM domain-containing protein [uncultured Ruminococcus sp.]